MSTTSTTLRPPVMATALSRPPPRPYKDFLTPSLHRRFARASLTALAPCYVISIWMGEWDLFWQWFPLGQAGVRTILLFLSVLAVYILRVARWHFGPRTTPSEFDTFLQFAIRLTSLQTFAWYIFSAWFFCEIYIWSRDPEAELAMVNPGRAYERARLNERPICLRSMFFCLGVSQAMLHLYNDSDRVRLQVGRLKPNDTSKPPVTLVQKLTQLLVPIAVKASYRAGIMSIVGLVSYLTLFRATAWEWTFTVARTIFTLPKNSRPSRFPPYLADLIGRFFVEAFLLVFLWEFVNEIFNIFVSQEPIKKDQPITNDSKDPNGSLLNGLVSKKEIPRTTAFRELMLIAHEFPTRRIAIYKDIERTGGSAWSQVLIVCLAELIAISKRIQDFQKPQPVTNDATQELQPPIQRLARISQPIKQDNVFTNSPPPKTFNAWAANEVGTFAKQRGEYPGAPDPISPHARKLLTYGADQMFSKEHQEQLSSTSGLGSFVETYVLSILRTPVGAPFRHTFARRAAGVVLDHPYGSISPIVAATYALSKLAICSIKDDEMGQVSRDVANIVRTFTTVIETIESFMKTLSVHWTDVQFNEADGRRVDGIEVVLGALRDGLGDLINEFAEYRDELGLSLKEIRMAKEAVARGRAPDMVER